MKIDKGALVTLHVRMFNAQGELLEESHEPLVYLQGHADIFPQVEAALQGHERGFHTTLSLEPEDAFGDYDPELVDLVPVEQLGGAVTAGETYTARSGGGDERTYVVTDVADGMAVLDGNHPLAGQALRFEVKVLDVEQATPEQLEAADAAALVPEFLSVARGASMPRDDDDDDDLQEPPRGTRLH